MQVFFVNNVNFFRFKVAAMQTFILGQIHLRTNFFKTACGVADFHSNQRNLQIFLKLRVPLLGAIFEKVVPYFSTSSSIYYLSLRCNKRHTIHKNNLPKQNKNNFFHDRRLEGTCYGHLVKQPPVMHVFAHKSFRPTSI